MEDLIADHKPPGRMPDADAPSPAFEYPKEAIISYAQTHEDVLLWRALHTVQRGFYVDVGAHDPTDLSVTRAFYDSGWRGINVEPNPYYAEKLRNERPRDVTLEVALGHSPGMATLYEFGDTGLSTLVKDIAGEHMQVGFKAAERRVPVTTLAAILDDLGDQQVHFLKIDVEGYERQVLLGADFSKIRPWIVLLEAVKPMTSISSYDAWEPLLLEAGYEFVYFDGLNRFYVAEEHRDLGRYFSAPVSICDPFRDGELVRLSSAVAELERDNAQQAREVVRLSEVAADLERLRAMQASEVVRLSEVAADLERDRMAQASEVVRLSEVAAELERDRMAQASEVARLSAVVSQLRRDRMKHEVPRLGGSPATPIAGDAGDAEAMLQIVEAQASGLVRLRRALLSAHTLAAQRLQLVHADAVARGTRGDPEQWVRSAALAEIARVKDAIGDVVERSRWRRAGQRLGLAKRLAWETGDWRTDFAVAGAGSTAGADGRGPEPSTAELLRELERLHGLLHHMRLSRWRKLGQWLGLAKRLPWESGGWPDPLLIRPFPSSEATPRPSEEAKTGSSPSSYLGFVEYANERFLEECRGFATDVILDVGANTGQFAQGLRASGYHGHIISFEPLSEAYARVVAAAAADPLWDVAERCAVGGSDNWAEINIARNSYSSSLLPMLDRHREAAPESAYQGTESCRVTTLDSYIERTFADPTTLFGLKIDTQGYEAQVLAGLSRNHQRVKVIVCEMSLAPLYADGPGMSELCRLLAELGYRCVALGPEFEDPRTGELLQANGVFVKRC
jgi:FkbM family methyltransferase